MDNRPIGVFDSGIGGLTAMQELTQLLPNEHIIYLGDSANMPYGEKSADEIVAMSKKNLAFLLSRNVKAVFVACGTATVNALDILRAQCPVPIIGVVEAAVSEALAITKNNRIGVLATRASIRAQTFQTRLKALRPDVFVEARACPIFATMVEYGIFDKDNALIRRASDEYLPPLRKAAVDTVILGCTHYPLLSEVIHEYVGKDVQFISSGAAAARSLSQELKLGGMLSEAKEQRLEYFTTGDSDEFARCAKFMLMRDISRQLTKLDLPENT